MDILYEDRDILVVTKPAGLLTVSTDKARERTAYWLLTDYVRKGCAKSSNRVFIVHRLDRDTSGILVFAKTEEAKFRLQEDWPRVEKTYLAIVHGHLEKPEGTISSYLAENSAQVVYSTTDTTLGKLSHTAYRVVQEANGMSLLEIKLLTGRKNQIRVHLADAGHPVVGDTKYGRKNDGHKRLGLHARTLAFKHPFNGKPLVFESPPPPHFRSTRAGQLPDSDASAKT